MRLRQRARLIPQQEGQIHHVAGAPDAALAVNQAFQALLDLLAAHVEMAERERGAVIQFQKAGLIAEMRRHDERLAVEMERRHAVGVGARHALRLLLIIEQRDFDAGKRLRGLQIRRNDGHVLQIAFGNQADVGDQHIARHRDVVFIKINVIRPVAGVIAVIAILVIIVIVIIPIALFAA